MVTGDSASAQVRSNLNLDPFAVDRIMASLDDFSPLRTATISEAGMGTEALASVPIMPAS